jgi:pilus assembly protein CpaB
MNKRFLSVILFALVISVVASAVLYRLISTRMMAAAKASSGQLIVATHNLDIGALIREIDVKTMDWNGPPPKGALTSSADILGRGVTANIYEGEPILDSRLAAKGAGAGLAATIPPGMRAVAVRVNDVVGVSGFALPGMRVDVLIAGNPPGVNNASTGVITKTLLQNIEVLSAGQNIQKDAEGKPVTVQVVNLLVTPEEAETLSLASNETRIQLILRNPLDTKASTTKGTAVANLFAGTTGLSETAAPKPAPRRGKTVVQARVVAPPPQPEPVQEKIVIPLTVEVITGTSRAETKFKPEEAKQ